MLQVIILGKCFKKETNLTIGSPSILLSNILKERNIDHEMYDPHVDGGEPPLKSAKLYFIGTNHDAFRTYIFPKGSTVIDPWRMIKDQKGVKVIRIGE